MTYKCDSCHRVFDGSSEHKLCFARETDDGAEIIDLTLCGECASDDLPCYISTYLDKKEP